MVYEVWRGKITQVAQNHTAITRQTWRLNPVYVNAKHVHWDLPLTTDFPNKTTAELWNKRIWRPHGLPEVCSGGSLCSQYFLCNCYSKETASTPLRPAKSYWLFVMYKWSLMGRQGQSLTASVFSSNCLINTVTTWPSCLVRSRQAHAWVHVWCMLGCTCV